jgi:integrase
VILIAYLKEAGLSADKNRKEPLFRTVDRCRQLTDGPIHRNDVIRMIKRRGRAVGLPPGICCHTFRATSITDYLENGGTIEKAQAIAAHHVACKYSNALLSSGHDLSPPHDRMS